MGTTTAAAFATVSASASAVTPPESSTIIGTTPTSVSAVISSPKPSTTSVTVASPTCHSSLSTSGDLVPNMVDILPSSPSISQHEIDTDDNGDSEVFKNQNKDQSKIKTKTCRAFKRGI